MHPMIANAIDDSKREFRGMIRQAKIGSMTTEKNDTPQLAKLRRLVTDAGGPAEFSRRYGKNDEGGINPVYVSQLLNHHRGFGEKSRAKMAKCAGLPEDFFELSRPAVGEPVAEYRALSAEIVEIVRICGTLPSNWQTQALGAVRMIAAQYAEEQNSKNKRA